MPIDPNIPLSIKTLELPNPVTQYATALQVRNAKLQGDEAQLALDESRGLKSYLLGNVDVNDPKVQQEIMNNFGKSGAVFIKNKSDQQTSDLTRQKTSGEVVDAALKRSREELATVQTPEQYVAWHERNHTDPILGQYFKERGINKDQKRAEIDMALSTPQGFTSLLNQSKLGVEKALENHYVDQNLGGSTRVLRAPKYGDGTATVVPGSMAAVTRSPNAPKTTINVTNQTQGAYGKKFGEGIAEEDLTLYQNANKAPETIRNANQIVDLLNTGNVITGTGANAILGLSKALKVAGVNDTERIANTEQLMSSLAQSTLQAVRTAGLGTGQGFTEGDRKFVEKAAAGDIVYDAQSIRRLAQKAINASVLSVNKWNDRSNSLPAEALQGTGVGKINLPSVPSSQSAPRAVPKTGEVRGGYKFLGGNPADKKRWRKV